MYFYGIIKPISGELRGLSMKKYQIPKSSFLYKFSMRFLLLILVPVIVGWLIFIEAMNYFYADNFLNSQQISMEKSISSLETSLNATSNAITALESNTEIIYYLDYYSDKPEMLYSLKKNILSFCDSLYSMSSYLSGIKIYSDSPILLYSAPFEKLENIPLKGDPLNELLSSKPKEAIWRVALDETKKFPSIYRYEKFYAYNYAKVIGYIEIQLSPQIFSDYFKLLDSLLGNPDSRITLYYEDTPLYSTDGILEPVKSSSEVRNGYQMNYWKQTYENRIQIPELHFSLVRTGSLKDLNTAGGKVILTVISIVIVFLLLLIVIFFSSVASLSKRILDFSSFIRHSDTDNLKSYQPASRYQADTDELAVLIHAYNEMITENTALISKVQKMELLSQNARYQALQGQIHPHFIYGTLEAIRMTALQNKDRETASMIFSLSALIRYSISISPKAVTLKDEVEIASHYMKIQKIRFDDRLDYIFSIDETLLSMEMPSFILQPLLENAIIYGASNSLEPCQLLVSVRQEEEDIVLQVSNSGLPITEERLKEVNNLLSGKLDPKNFHGNRNGMALSNIRERLLIFFHGKTSICMNYDGSYTSTIITIKNRNYFEEGKN